MESQSSAPRSSRLPRGSRQIFEFSLQIQGPDQATTFPIPPGPTLIGREAGSGLQLPYPQVSRQHARLTCSPTGCQIIDLGSANGTSLNGEKLVRDVPVPLVHGATLRIGPCSLTFAQVAVDLPVEEPAPGDESPGDLPIPPAPEDRSQVPEDEWQAPGPGQEAFEGSPPVPPGLPPSVTLDRSPDGSPLVPPGLSTESIRLIHYLPGIYQTDFTRRFLALFESILIPIEWTVDNFDLFLDPGTAPPDFLPWLANWYAIVFNPSWDEVRRRAFLKDAHQIYARRGTRWALSRVLEIYTGKKPEIIEFAEGMEAHTFTVQLPFQASQIDRELVERLIDIHKPAHTTYTLKLQK